MNIDENKRLVRQFLRAVERLDGTQMDALTTADFTWWVIPSTKLSGLYHKAQFLAVVSQLSAEAPGGSTLTIGEVTAEGDRVSVTAEGCMVLKNGKVYENHYHYLFTVREAKICAGKEYCDSARVNAFFGAP